VQGEAYRSMRKLTGGAWSAFWPGTNCLWLQYLCEVLMKDKGLVLQRPERRMMNSFKVAAGCAAVKGKSCRELLDQPLFQL
jgi:Haspin like kinase domain